MAFQGFWPELCSLWTTILSSALSFWLGSFQAVSASCFQEKFNVSKDRSSASGPRPYSPISNSRDPHTVQVPFAFPVGSLQSWQLKAPLHLQSSFIQAPAVSSPHNALCVCKSSLMVRHSVILYTHEEESLIPNIFTAQRQKQAWIQTSAGCYPANVWTAVCVQNLFAEPPRPFA